MFMDRKLNEMLSYPSGKGPKERLNGDSIKRRRGRPIGSGVSQDKTIADHKSNGNCQNDARRMEAAL